MGHYSTTGAPPWAILTWVDDNHVYTQIPSKDGGQPLIQRYALTDGGLGKALATLRDIHRERNPPGLGYQFLERTATKCPPKGKAAPPLGTPEQREAVRRILKKQGIL